MTGHARLGASEDFEIGVRYSAHPVVVSVHGEVDISTATELGDIVNVVIDGRQRGVVLDLARCSFLDASGLEVMATAARRLRLLALSETLVVRTPSAMVRRIMTITGLDQVVTIEELPPSVTHLDREQEDFGRFTGIRADEDTVAHSLSEVTTIPADRDVVDGALRLVVALARATVDGADGVSISLSRHGILSTVAASDQTILDMDADQYVTGEGPCVDASIKGRWFHATSLDAETRWPAFVPKAKTLGINAILSNPLLAGDRPVGALNIYSNRSGAFKVKDQNLAAVFAAEASSVLTNAGAGVTDEQLAGRLVEALHSREIISQAQGVLMKRDGVPAEAAYALLRQFSRTSNRSIRDLAEETVALSLGPELRTTAGSRGADD
jgi:anti-anti-sigma factor